VVIDKEYDLTGIYKDKILFTRKSDFLFAFYQDVASYIIQELPEKTLKRWNFMRDIFGDIYSCPLILYIIRRAHKDEGSSGKCFGRHIICYADDYSELDMPFIHEEAHMFANLKWRRHTPFINEGLAEYIVAKTEKNLHFMHHEDNYIIPSRLYEDLACINNMIFYSSSDELQEYRKQGRFTYQMAGSLFFFIERQIGTERLSKLLSKPAQNGYPRLYIELHEWILKWFIWLSKTKEYII